MKGNDDEELQLKICTEYVMGAIRNFNKSKPHVDASQVVHSLLKLLDCLYSRTITHTVLMGILHALHNKDMLNEEELRNILVGAGLK